MSERVNHMMLIMRESNTRCAGWIRSVSPAAMRLAVIGGCCLFWVSVILLVAF